MGSSDLLPELVGLQAVVPERLAEWEAALCGVSVSLADFPATRSG